MRPNSIATRVENSYYFENRRFLEGFSLHLKNSADLMIGCFVEDLLKYNTVKPFITNTSEDFMKCRLDNFSMSFILYYVTFSICENK